MKKQELEDLYLPYRPKRRTRATIASGEGLELLAAFIRMYREPEADIVTICAPYLREARREQPFRTRCRAPRTSWPRTSRRTPTTASSSAGSTPPKA